MATNSAQTNTFMLTLRKEVIENRKALMIGIGSCWGLCMLLGAFLGLLRMGGGAREVYFFFFMCFLIAGIIGSLTFSNMKTKTGRISSILLPATPIEKFFIRWLAVVPGLLIVLILGFYIGDASRIITSWIDGAQMGSHYYRIVDIWRIVMHSFGESNMSIMMSCFLICSYFFTQALYIYGAILWPKLSYVKTLLALWVLEMALGPAFIFILKHIGFSFNMLTYAQAMSILWIACTLLVVLTLALYFLTYLRFKNSQVIYKLF